MAKKQSSFSGKVGDDAQRNNASASYGYIQLPTGVKMFSPETDSSVKLDFIPYVVTDPLHMDRNDDKEIAVADSLWYKRPYYAHRNIGASNDSVVCLQTVKKKCPICEHRAKLIKEGAAKEDTDALKPSKRNLYIVIPLNSKKFESVPHVFDISQYLFQNLLNKELKEAPENEIFPDLELGKSLKVRFDSSTIGTSKPFAEAGRIDFVARDDMYTEEILNDIPNPDDLLKILSYKELEDLFLEMPEENDGGKLSDDNEDKKETKRTVTRVSKTSKPKEEETPPEEETTWDELDAMSERRLLKLIDEKELKVDSNEYVDDVDGLKKAIAEELDIEMPKKAPARTASRGTEKETSRGGDKCPHGHKFGIDFEKFPECPDCKLWDDCYDANKKLKAKK